MFIDTKIISTTLKMILYELKFTVNDTPDLTDEQLDKLMLKKYKKDRKAREKQKQKNK